MRLNKRLDALLLCGWLALGALSAPAHAAQIHWKNNVSDYSAEGKDLKDMLRDFGASQGIPTKIAPDVSGTVSGKFHLPPRRFLDTLASSFGFVWYYDGEVLDITSSSSLESTLLKLDTAGTESLRQTLSTMGVADDRFPIVYDMSQGTALVSGPPRYVQLVTEIANRLDANAARRGGSQVRVFPLHHAWSDDRTVNVDGQKVTLLGVVAVLNNIYHPKQGSDKDKDKDKGGKAPSTSGLTRNSPMQDVNGSSSNSPYAALPPLPGGGSGGGGGILSGLTGQPSPAVAAALGPQAAPTESTASSAPPQSEVLPVIVADQRTNSVIIRDTGDRMNQYDELINRLDVKPQLIEIEAHIIEIDDNALKQLGVDWTAHNSHVDIQSGTGTLAQSTYSGSSITQNFGSTTLPGSVTTAASPVGVSVAAVLGDAGRYLMARISALQQDNLARMDASPKVVTLNNIEAVMDNKTQFFVPVQGYTSGDLYSISTGISLRVLPMVVEEDGVTRIKLDVSIEDGSLSTSQTVSNLPVIQSSNITTQAFINEGQALLIAGYRSDESSGGVTGIPGLMKIPLLGGLFRTDNKSKSHLERLFLLTPHVISP